MTGAVYFDFRARAPWVAETPPISRIRDRVMPNFEHIIAFHMVLNGSCWAYLAQDPESPVRLETGDAVIFTSADTHVMSTERGQRATPDLSLYRLAKERTLPYVLNEFGGAGEATQLACGYLGCDARPFNPILSALPPLLHVRAAGVGGSLIHELIRVALRESEAPRAGGETILSKLSELLFLQAVRQYLDGLPTNSTGWLSGLRDRHIGMTLSLMHGRPADRWTLDTLAREVGLSRSAFAERFAAVMGVPPMQYLANWRLQIAAQHLESRSMSIAQAAAEVGYESEAAFNRAFKKQVGMPPGLWRRSRMTASHSELA
jgi:AraC-like DNA-binding protein